MSAAITKADSKTIADADNSDVTAEEATRALAALKLGDEMSIDDLSNRKIFGKWILQGVAGNIAVQGQIHMGDVSKMRLELWKIIEGDSAPAEVKVSALKELNTLLATTFPNIAAAQLKAAEIVGISGKAKKHKKTAPQIRTQLTVAIQNNPKQ